MIENDLEPFYPTRADVEIINFLLGLERVFDNHRKLFQKTNESIPFYPKEIVQYLNFSGLDDAWDSADYDFIREEYIKAYLLYVESIAGEKAYFTVDEFLNGTAQRELDS